MAKYECKVCGYIYNEQHAGRPFAEITECPICNESKDNFFLLEGEEVVSEWKDEDEAEVVEGAAEHREENRDVAEEMFDAASENDMVSCEKQEELVQNLYEEVKAEPAQSLYEEVKTEPVQNLYEEVKADTEETVKTDMDEAPEFVVERRQDFWSPVSFKEERQEEKRENLGSGWTISNAMGAVEKVIGVEKEEKAVVEEPVVESKEGITATILNEVEEEKPMYESRIESFYTNAEPVGTSHIIGEEEEEEAFRPFWNSGVGTVQRVIDSQGDKEPVVKAGNVEMVVPSEMDSSKEDVVTFFDDDEPDEEVPEMTEREANEVFFFDEDDEVEEIQEVLSEEELAAQEDGKSEFEYERVERTDFNIVEEFPIMEPEKEKPALKDEAEIEGIEFSDEAEEAVSEESEEVVEVPVTETVAETIFADWNDVEEAEIVESAAEEMINEWAKTEEMEEVPVAEENDNAWSEAEVMAEEAPVAEENTNEWLETETVEEVPVAEEMTSEWTEVEAEASVAEEIGEWSMEEDMTDEETETEVKEEVWEETRAPRVKAWTFLDDLVEAGDSKKAEDTPVFEAAYGDNFVEEPAEEPEMIYEVPTVEAEITENVTEDKVYDNQLDKILILPAQLNPMPLPEGTEIGGTTVLGIASTNPLIFENPVFSTGEYNMVQYIPNSGLTSEDYQRADAIEIVIGQGTGVEKNINTKEDLRQVVNFLRLESDGCPIGIKMRAGRIERDLEFCEFAKPDYVVFNNFDVVPLPYALHRARKYLNTLQSSMDIVIALDGAKDGEELAKIMAMGADIIALRNHPTNMDEMLDCMKEVARITGHYEVEDLNVKDLCTIDREIAEYTDIYHV